ncbi:XrtA/PEP-CTERM system-associated ATPase [Colwellia psychrerythraea]|uniref:Putative general secretion pathway protein A n=1 Tax=Colwellia psychrerythraea (strain 34H / ATCC BAA-681) TaxID=167879 RepID=Q47U55_COLP3|nr:XrtA/PEP-CTERM system-associated ATPase [Colwellia psychrerythraea]AAZ24470.1 putative general secretion pathway protein A [Colwellia psychrerythraea 34H]
MYESYYGFSERPFQLSPDPRFFFATNHHQRALSYLQYGLDQGEGFIVITGPIGTGKTTIARNLLANIADENIVAAQLVTTKLTPNELLDLVAAEFKITVTGNSKADVLQSIEKFLINLNKQGKRALLLVDEAQNLPVETVEELRMLSNFQLDNKPLIQSFLLGQEELKAIISAPDMEQFRQRIIASAHLKPLNAEEVKNYINHRLAQANCNREALFSDEAFQLIFEKTLGVPRKINIFVDRLLLFGFLEELNNIDCNAINEVAKEMSVELTGSLSGNVLESDNKHQPLVINSTENVENIKNVLREVEEILESSIQQKVKMTRYIDKLLKQKNREFAELQSKTADSK